MSYDPVPENAFQIIAQTLVAARERQELSLSHLIRKNPHIRVGHHWFVLAEKGQLRNSQGVSIQKKELEGVIRAYRLERSEDKIVRRQMTIVFPRSRGVGVDQLPSVRTPPPRPYKRGNTRRLTKGYQIGANQ